MSITLDQQHSLASNGNFIYKVRQAMADQALAVMSEDPANLDGGNTELNHRMSLARRVINDPQSMAQRTAFLLVTADALNVDRHDEIPDNAYLAFVAANWSALAGYNPNYVEGG